MIRLRGGFRRHVAAIRREYRSTRVDPGVICLRGGFRRHVAAIRHRQRSTRRHPSTPGLSRGIWRHIAEIRHPDSDRPERTPSVIHLRGGIRRHVAAIRHRDRSTRRHPSGPERDPSPWRPSTACRNDPAQTAINPTTPERARAPWPLPAGSTGAPQPGTARAPRRRPHSRGAALRVLHSLSGYFDATTVTSKLAVTSGCSLSCTL